MTVKLYTYTVFGVRLQGAPGSAFILTGSARASSREEAEGIALADARKKRPPEEGWGGFDAEVGEGLTSEQLRDIAYRGETRRRSS